MIANADLDWKLGMLAARCRATVFSHESQAGKRVGDWSEPVRDGLRLVDADQDHFAIDTRLYFPYTV